MNAKEQKANAKKFLEEWSGKGYEKGQSQPFWLQLLRLVLGVENPEQFITFEEQVKLDHTSFIDGYISDTKVLIEQKSIDKNLKSAIKQSDGTLLTPFQQAKRYITELPLSKHPRWVIISNFQEFHIYDMEKPSGEPEIVYLKDLEKDYYRLQFIVDTGSELLKKEMEVSVKAGELVGLIYDALIKQYINPESEETLKSLNMLCVRIVFCLYAEDAGIFGKKNMFHDYLIEFEAKDMRKALINLFKILDTPSNKRDPYETGLLAEFPYVNGGLFADENIEIPNFTDEIREIILSKASDDFDWSEISPTIFGAVFESTLNPETRRSGGMHYTSIENIHKVIDPLFLDELKEELSEIKDIKILKTKSDKLKKLQEKISNLTFLDPACGSGNFLTETYISLRKLENEILKELYQGQISFEFVNPIKVSIEHFYGIEINDFAVTVAKTALWIAESQMLKESEMVVHMQLDFLPLKTNAYIVEGNANEIDWSNVINPLNLNYIMGNPPFSAGRRMGDSQRKDMNMVASDFSKNGELDYVSLWYIKAARYMQNTKIKAGFVSTSSITQGEQVVLLWKTLFEKYNLSLFYVIRSFNWVSEAKIKAGVHCIIALFTIGDWIKDKYIVDKDIIKKANYINGYFLDAPNVWIEGQKKPISNVPTISNGSKPLDNAICAFTTEEKEEFIKKEPKSAPYFYKYMGSKEFINNIDRWFLIINRIPPHELKNMPKVIEKLEAIREYRLSSSSEQTYKLAETPAKFHFENMPTEEYLVIPQTSSGRRRYVPIGFLPPSVMVNNKLQVMKNGGEYELGVLSSNVHNAWLRAVGGRLREDFTYSVSVVYNTFPWITVDELQKNKIISTAKSILSARDKYMQEGASLADLYGEFMYLYPELLKAHTENDKAVMEAYGFIKTDERGKRTWYTESETVSALMKMYQELTKSEK